MKKEQINWNFPGNNNGQIFGIAEAGIETFKGHRIASLTRETIQNSLDAQLDKSKPVKVKFQLSMITLEDVPGIFDLIDAFCLSKDTWKDNKKCIDFFSNALETCQDSEIRLLRVSDFNTTGLTGSKQEKDSCWLNLVKSSGVSNKTGTAGGSFGIGKSAPFACSDLRTIFYSTLDKDGNTAYQGVSKLVSFKYPDSDEFTQGTGYYGNAVDNSPIFEVLNLDGFERKEPGTDIYIVGFLKKDTWKHEILKEAIDNYLVSIMNNTLEVIVDNVLLNKETLPQLISKYKEDITFAYNYYNLLTGDIVKKITFTNFEGLGDIDLYIGIKKEYHRKVLMTRSNGMKIFDQDRISGSIRFCGVCILKDPKVDAFFREMEHQDHTKWEEERHSNPKLAKKVRTSLYRSIKDAVINLGKASITDKTDAIGASDFIPDISDKELTDNQTENINDTISDYNLTKVDSIISDADNPTPEDTGFNAPLDTNFDQSGILDTDDNEDNISDNSNSGQSSDDTQDNLPTSQTTFDNFEDIDKLKSIKPLNLTLFYSNNTYNLIFIPNKNVKKAYIEIFISGEQSNLKINVLSAKSKTGTLTTAKNKIFIGDILEKHTYKLTFDIDFEEPCPVEAIIYGY